MARQKHQNIALFILFRINSAADWGPSNPLSIVKTALEMRKKEYGEDVIQQLVWDNPIRFYSQSGKLRLGEWMNNARRWYGEAQRKVLFITRSKRGICSRFLRRP
ncbi:hypothetical protein [Paenibacillus sp. J2TS4]|uniref:hypothetical protein n=1 Tax=Paenibacillus sp. J2TS4 TaxID=2807194 RepID=UPI0020C01D9C|nr:hypothetical protein [Paenibacillus sp. J2TS4]